MGATAPARGDTPPVGKCQKGKIRFSYHVLVRTKRTEMSPDWFYGFKIYLNVFAAGAVPRTPLGNQPYSALPDLPAAFEPFCGEGIVGT